METKEIEKLKIEIPEITMPFKDVLNYLVEEVIDNLAKETLLMIENNTKEISNVLSQKSELQNELIKALQSNKEIYNSFVELQGKYKTTLVQLENVLAENQEFLNKYQALSEKNRKLEALNNVRNRK